MASFVPTFEPPAPQEDLEVLDDEEPDAVSLSKGSDFHFFFLVDRSGSMTSAGRMDSAKEALKLFIRSLPTGCKFTIISFGSRYSYALGLSEGAKTISYTEQSKKHVIE